MSLIEVIILAIALSIDICVVSFSQGLIFTHNKLKNSLFLATAVGLLHFLMPILGGAFAHSISRFVSPIDHWIVFGIFFLLGTKFVVDAFKVDDGCEKCISKICFSHVTLIAIATSIDALGVGITLYFSKTGIIKPAIIIGITAFLFSNLGFALGNFFKKFPSRGLEIAGGLILILLGFKTLFEHYGII